MFLLHTYTVILTFILIIRPIIRFYSNEMQKKNRVNSTYTFIQKQNDIKACIFNLNFGSIFLSTA